ncbi:MAG: dTMP kinase [Peptococcaceae bacterium]|jgi:dTMP kinase|nr:dTMP kinase [Peptococcaceae bacterium]
MEKKGKFIVLEGLDGCGTTTQTGLLRDWFAGEGKAYGAAWVTREPTDGPAGTLARLALNKRLALDPYTLALLFAADRADHLYRSDAGGQEPGVLAHLRAGIHVISDRYVLSSLAYQALDAEREWIGQINSQALKPDLIVYMDIEPETAARRLDQARPYRDLYEALEKQRAVRRHYEEGILFLTARGYSVCRVNGDLPPAEVAGEIRQAILPLLMF